jgi:hypothetical protein
MWRRSLIAKLLWGVGITAWTAVAAFGSGIEPDERVAFLLLGAGAALFAWSRVWRPHLAATRDGLVVRRAWSAVLIAWPDVVEVQVWGNYGVHIRVRSGQPLNSVVPRRAALWWFLNVESEADEAAVLINERASSHREPPGHPAVAAAPGSPFSAGAGQASTPARAASRLTASSRRSIALAVVVVSAAVGGLAIHQMNRIDASFQELRLTGVATPAQVVDVRTTLGFVRWSVEYTYAGTAYREGVSCNKYCFERGEQITIHIDPRSPDRFITDSGRKSMSSAQLLVAVLTIAGMAAVLAAGYLIREWIIHRPEPDRLVT